MQAPAALCPVDNVLPGIDAIERERRGHTGDGECLRQAGGVDDIAVDTQIGTVRDIDRIGSSGIAEGDTSDGAIASGRRIAKIDRCVCRRWTERDVHRRGAHIRRGAAVPIGIVGEVRGRAEPVIGGGSKRRCLGDNAKGQDGGEQLPVQRKRWPMVRFRRLGYVRPGRQHATLTCLLRLTI